MIKQPLNLSHRPLITKLCADLSLPLSEYNFSNLYLFRDVHAYTLIDRKTFFLIQGISRDKKAFLMPLYRPSSFHELASLAASQSIPYIFPIPEMWMREAESEGFTLTFSPNDSDYLYDRKVVEELRGRHLDGHRNHVRHLLEEHTMKVAPLGKENLHEAFCVLERWTSERKNPHESDAQSSKEALELFFELELQGWLFYADDTPVGFLIGEPLTNDTFLFHFSKASPIFQGLYQYMFQETAKALPSQFSHINWEQDLGLENIRYMKHSYHPESLVRKGWITTSQEESSHLDR